MRIKGFLWFLLFALSVSSLFIVSTAHAQTARLDLTVSPVLLDVTASPGDKIQQKFRVRNNSSQLLNLIISINRLNQIGEAGQIAPLNPQPGDEAASWVTFDKNTFKAPVKEWTDVNLTINVPKDAAFGYYYAIRVTQNPADIPQKGGAAKLVGEVIVPLLLNAKKEGAVRQAKLLDFKPVSFVNEYMPVDFLTRVQNTGNIHMKVRGNIFIRGQGTKDIGILEVNPGLGIILPGAKRAFPTSWDDGFIVMKEDSENGIPKLDSHGKPKKSLTINWDKITNFRIGKYTANLLLVYDDGTRDQTLEGSTTFWVFPYKLVGAIIVVAIGAVLLLRMILSSYIKKQVKKSQSK